MKTTGFLYIATSDKYIQAAIRSAKTVLKHCPGLPIHLYVDANGYDVFFKDSTFPFTSINQIENPHSRSKVDYLSHTPFESTLYLDTDTALNTDIRGIFEVLDRFDIAMAHAHHRSSGNLKPWRIVLPDAFPEFNSGVILYRKTPEVLQLMQNLSYHFGTDWIETGIKNGQLKHDQTPLRELLWLSDLRIATLPPEYNVRNLKYHILWSKSEAATKIFHLKQLHRGWLQWLFRRPIRIARKIIRKLRSN